MRCYLPMRSDRYHGFLLFIVLLLSAELVAAHCESVATNTLMAGKLSSGELSILMLEDPQRQLTIYEVEELPDEVFKETSGALSSAMRGGRLWLRLCLLQPENAPSDWVLALLPAYLESVTLYNDSEHGHQVSTQGSIYPFAEKQIDYRGFAYTLSVPSNTHKRYTLALDFYNRTTADVVLVRLEKLSQLMAVDYTLFGFSTGMVLLVVFVNLSFWGVSRRPVFFHYAASVLFFGAFSSLSGGYAAQFLFPEWSGNVYPWLMSSVALFSPLLLFLFSLLFNSDSTTRFFIR